MNATISLRENVLIIESDFGLRDAIKALPGARWNPSIVAWTRPATPSAAAETAEALANGGATAVELAPGVNTLAWLYHHARGALDAPAVTTPPSSPLWNHQQRGVDFCHYLIGGENVSGGAMLAWEMGVGKTFAALTFLLDHKFQRILVVCPKAVVPVWPEQIAKHVPGKIHAAGLVKGSVSKRTGQAEHHATLAKALGLPVLLAVNYEAVWRQPMADWVLGQHWDLVIADEIHRIKAPGGKASKYMAQLGRYCNHRLGLTGTPMPHSPLDLYAQLRFLDPSIFGTSFTRFRARYAVLQDIGPHGGKRVLDYQNLDELRQRFARITHLVRSDDVLDLPEQRDVNIPVHLGTEAATLYADLERDFVAEIEAGEITLTNALTRLLRLQQITSGHIRTDDGVLADVGTAKYDVLRETIGDLPREPVVVVCRFKPDLAATMAAAAEDERQYRELSGRINELDDWKSLAARGAGPVLGVQIQSGKEGIDLTAARFAIFYSLGFSLGDYQQMRKRLHRPGQERVTTYFHLVARGTVDEKVYRALEQRLQVVEYVLAEMRGGEQTAGGNASQP